MKYQGVIEKDRIILTSPQDSLTLLFTEAGEKIGLILEETEKSVTILFREKNHKDGQVDGLGIANIRPCLPDFKQVVIVEAPADPDLQTALTQEEPMLIELNILLSPELRIQIEDQGRYRDISCKALEAGPFHTLLTWNELRDQGIAGTRPSVS